MYGATALAGTIVVIQRGETAANVAAGGATTMAANTTAAPTLVQRDADACPWGDHAPLFVSRRRAWLHAVLSGEERAPRPA